MRRILRKILSGEEDSLGDTSTVSGYDLCVCPAFEADANTAVRPKRSRQDYWDCQGIAEEVSGQVKAWSQRSQWDGYSLDGIVTYAR